MHPIPIENVLLYQDWKLRVEDYLEKANLFVQDKKKKDRVKLTDEIKQYIIGAN